jgi:hypothetical protein
MNTLICSYQRSCHLLQMVKPVHSSSEDEKKQTNEHVRLWQHVISNAENIQNVHVKHSITLQEGKHLF